MTLGVDGTLTSPELFIGTVQHRLTRVSFFVFSKQILISTKESLRLCEKGQQLSL